MAVGKPAPSLGETSAGSDASSPWRMPWSAWKQVLLRTWSETGQDNISLVSAGVAFYGFGALLPLLAAIVLGYGLIADTASVVHQMQKMMAVMPADAAKLIAEQLLAVVKTSSSKKGIGLFVALAIALYGARNGASAIVTALNIAYEEEEKRSFVRQVLLSLAITAGGVLIAIVALIAISALGHLEDLLGGAPGFVVAAGKLLSYVILILSGAAAAATLYRFGPDREKARWVWITPGSVCASVFWLLLTLGFGLYVADFGSYNATYGSLGAVIVFLTWLYLSAYIFLLGAELNSEFERQTRRPTTVSEQRPAVQDHVDASSPQQMSDAPQGSAMEEPSLKADLVTCAVTGRAFPLMGLPWAGRIPAVLVSVGLACVRREGKAGLGLLLINTGAAWAWLGRRPLHRRPASEVEVATTARSSQRPAS